MGLFTKKKPKEQPVKEYSFTLSHGFRGYKKFPMTVHGNPVTERNNEQLKDAALPGRTITFRQGTEEQFLFVFLDGEQIGVIFDDSQIAAITSGKVKEVYAKVEPQPVAEKGKIIDRHRVYLFVKYAEP